MARGLKQTLRDEIRDVLSALLRDKAASAIARAQAARSLLEMEREDNESGARDERPAAEMSERDIDDEIARIKGR